ncbi:hypothetical protein STENM36S_00682 [Streptomyces tendae]
MPVSAPPRVPSALVGLPVLLFVLITWQVVADGPLAEADERLSRALVHPDRMSPEVTEVGSPKARSMTSQLSGTSAMRV